MSDIGSIFSPFDLVVIGLILGSPGLPLGAIAGFGLWLLGWLYFSDNL
jgi:hypothetical protein